MRHPSGAPACTVSTKVWDELRCRTSFVEKVQGFRAHMLAFGSDLGGGARASITGPCLRAGDGLQPWQRAPHLNTCYSDAVKHMPTPLVNPGGQGVGLREPVEACPVAAGQMQAATENARGRSKA